MMVRIVAEDGTELAKVDVRPERPWQDLTLFVSQKWEEAAARRADQGPPPEHLTFNAAA